MCRVCVSCACVCASACGTPTVLLPDFEHDLDFHFNEVVVGVGGLDLKKIFSNQEAQEYLATLRGSIPLCAPPKKKSCSHFNLESLGLLILCRAGHVHHIWPFESHGLFGVAHPRHGLESLYVSASHEVTRIAVEGGGCITV